jgi:hypothetical protein
MALGLFLLLSVGVCGNALLLQSGPTSTAAGKLAAEKAAQKAAVERLKRLSAEAQPPVSEQIKMSAAVLQPAGRQGQKQPDSGPIPLEVLEKRADARPQRLAVAPPEAAIRLARLKPDAATPETLPDAPEAEGNPETIRAVQRELIARNYGPIHVDGVPGLLTRAAIMAFEADTKSALTGEATEALLKRLLLGTAGDKIVDPAAGKVRSAQAEIVIRTVQQSLTALGYQSGKSDGHIGDETARAIREFEMDHGLDPTGRVSAELFSRLAKAVGGARIGKVQP